MGPRLFRPPPFAIFLAIFPAIFLIRNDGKSTHLLYMHKTDIGNLRRTAPPPLNLSRKIYQCCIKRTQPTRVQWTTEAQRGVCYTVHTDSARLAPNRMLIRHLPAMIIIMVLCYVHFHVHFGIKSHAQLALANKIGILLPYRSSVGHLKVHY